LKSGVLFPVSQASIISNIVLFAMLLVGVPVMAAINPFGTFYGVRSNFSSHVGYFWGAVFLQFISIACSVFFVNHNDLFKMYGFTGVPRDMLAYTSIIWGTGAADLLQTLITFAYIILMGAFYYRVID